MADLSGMGDSWAVGIVICFVLMLCSKYTIVEKFRVNLVGKVKVERWGLFLILVKR